MVHINETDCFLVGVPGLEPVTWLVIALEAVGSAIVISLRPAKELDAVQVESSLPLQGLLQVQYIHPGARVSTIS